MEGSVTHLEEKLGELQIRLEDMFKAIMTSQGCKPLVFPPHSPKVPIPADTGRSAPAFFEGHHTRSLSRVDFVNNSTPFPEDLSASVSEPIHIDGEDIAAGKTQVDEFVEGLLKDPDERVSDILASPVLQPVNIGANHDREDKYAATEELVDVTCVQPGLQMAGHDSDSAEMDEVCMLSCNPL